MKKEEGQKAMQPSAREAAIACRHRERKGKERGIRKRGCYVPVVQITSNDQPTWTVRSVTFGPMGPYEPGHQNAPLFCFKKEVDTSISTSKRCIQPLIFIIYNIGLPRYIHINKPKPPLYTYKYC
jgi:hypothetical protein